MFIQFLKIHLIISFGTELYNNYVLINHSGFSGSVVNMFDYSNFLSKYGFITLYQDSRHLSFTDMLKMSLRNYTFSYRNFNCSVLECDILITDFLSVMWFSNNSKKIICNKVFILDNLELALYLLNIRNNKFLNLLDTTNICKKLKTNIISKEYNLLVTPFIYEKAKNKFPKLNVISHLKKIDISALNTIQYSETKKSFSREYINDNMDYIPNIYGTNVFNYKTYVYKRREVLSKIEMFGRLIFEFILLDKNIIFNDDLIKDGLNDYINYYGLTKQELLKNKIDINKYSLDTIFNGVDISEHKQTKN